MSFAAWAVVIGTLLTTMALAGSLLKRLPVSAAMLYLAVGAALGAAGWGLMAPDPIRHSAVLERVAEVAVVISLFAAGLKLGLPLTDAQWRLPLRLAVVSMSLTVGLIVLIASVGLGMSLGAAVLLGGILAPTDPVLASDVQVETAGDRDRLRFSLTGEGALNDAAAFPFVMLGLGMLGLHELGDWGWRWWLIDVVWALGGGLAIGAALGALIGKLVVYLRAHHQQSVGLDEFLTLGLIGLAYGIAVLCLASGFLAVLAAGLALQRVQVSGVAPSAVADAAPAPLELHKTQATDPAHAGAFMMQAVRGFNEQLERIGEVSVVLVVGAMLSHIALDGGAIVLTLLLLAVVRPVAVALGLWGAPVRRDQRVLISWFGIRGIGSVYYLMFAINHQLDEPLARQLTTITLTVVTASIVLHGISVTPLMSLYTKRKARTPPG
ncbi:MAG: sodium:proton antiporter [Methylibium sp. NZG]|nr:MAG: sodium:proton antiporter [Methylibium sp. NZG]